MRAGGAVRLDVRKPAASSALRAKCRYQCCFCTYISVFQAHVREHVMSHHLDYKPYSCAFCNFRAVRQCYVTTHVKHRHCAMLHAKRLSYYDGDDAMETRIDSGYYSVLLDEFAQKDRRGLQDHTYNAASLVADTPAASNVCRNSNDIRAHGIRSAGSGALKVTLFPKKKKKKPGSVRGKWNFHRCGHCTFFASSKKYLNMHISKKHRTLELRCWYCEASSREGSDMFIHWYSNHDDSPFRYQLVISDGNVVDVNTKAATVRAMVDDYLHTLSEFDDNKSTVPPTDSPSSEAHGGSAGEADAGSAGEADGGSTGEADAGSAGEADTGNEGTTGENAPAVVDDIIYCCETCPSSFSTPEALSSHNCTSSRQ